MALTVGSRLGHYDVTALIGDLCSATRCAVTPSAKRPFAKLAQGVLSLVLASAGLVGCEARDDQTLEEGTPGWLSDAVVPLVSADEEGVDRLRPLEDLIGSARVVALGEIVHRAHEPLAVRNQLFRFLVEELGFTSIALETGLAEAMVLRDFVRGEDLDLDTVVRRSFSWNFEKFRENRDLLEWIRAYNLDPSREHDLQLYGFDLPGGTGGVYFAHADRVVDAVLDYLAQANRVEAEALRDQFGDLLPRFTDQAYGSFSREDRDRLTAGLNDLVAVLGRRYLALVERSSRDDYQWMYQASRTLQQLDSQLRTIPAGWRPSPEEPFNPNAAQSMTARDLGMWDNVRWSLEQQAADAKTFIFAHNAHLQNAPTEFPNGSGTSLGQYLRSWLGNELVTIGTVHRSLSERGPFEPQYVAQASALANRLHQAHVPMLLLDVRSQPWSADEDAWWTAPQPLDYGFTTMHLPPASAFDIWLYIDELTEI